jgi:hypothetical protein
LPACLPACLRQKRLNQTNSFLLSLYLFLSILNLAFTKYYSHTSSVARLFKHQTGGINDVVKYDASNE